MVPRSKSRTPCISPEMALVTCSISALDILLLITTTACCLTSSDSFWLDPKLTTPPKFEFGVL